VALTLKETSKETIKEKNIKEKEKLANLLNNAKLF